MLFSKETTNMEKEIVEQIKTIPHILDQYTDKSTNEVNIPLPETVKKIVVVASGSSYHCARFAVNFFEKAAKIETRAIYSSEFLSKNIIPHDKNTLYIFITQSGETSDTLKAVDRVKNETGLPTLCITNVENSAIWKACDYQVACHAGKELGIAATKSLSAQILCVVLIAIKLMEGSKNNELAQEYKESLKALPEIIKEIVYGKREEIKKFAKHMAKANTIMVTADENAYSLAKEGTLKIKETSYKNISAFILGEFMHGHVAVLNNKGTLIYISVDKISERSVNNILKIKEDYHPTVAIIGKSDIRIKPDYHLYVNCENEIQTVFANLIILQCIALETAIKLKRNVDNPKGLHKVVVDKNI